MQKVEWRMKNAGKDPSGHFRSASCVLLSSFIHQLAESAGNAPPSAIPILFSRQVQPAYICLPSINEERRMRKEELRGGAPSIGILHSPFHVLRSEWLPGLDSHQ